MTWALHSLLARRMLIWFDTRRHTRRRLYRNSEFASEANESNRASDPREISVRNHKYYVTKGPRAIRFAIGCHKQVSLLALLDACLRTGDAAPGGEKRVADEVNTLSRFATVFKAVYTLVSQQLVLALFIFTPPRPSPVAIVVW